MSAFRNSQLRGGLPAAFLATALISLAISSPARAQVGSALSNNPLTHQSSAIKSGIDDLERRADKETAPRTIKDVQKGLDDVDPKVRVESLNKLRNLQQPEVNDLLLRGLADPDTRVKIKAIDILGLRQVNDAVPGLSQYLFLRSTAPVVKLHIVATLGRIGDARGVLPTMQYLEEMKDERSRGTAVFALGEMGDPRASELLSQVATNDSSPMVRRLSQEALEKIDGELPSRRVVTADPEKDKRLIPTDERLSRIRQMDAELHKVR